MIMEYDLTSENWREYDFGGRVYCIDCPVTLFTRTNGTTHRIVDACDIVHCCPAPGQIGCVMRWSPQDADDPVQF